MGSVSDLRLFVQECLRRYDPMVDLSSGAPATVQVVDPIVGRFSPDPVEADLELFVLTRLQQEFPELYAREGGALADMLVKPNRVLLEPLRREIRSVKKQKSILYPSQLNADEADALMGNIFVKRKTGSYARVVVRIYFQNPVSVSISSTNVAFTSTGLRFLPASAQAITADGMLFNMEGSLYYMDVRYIAERPGSAYNIGPGYVVKVTGLATATRATNISAATPGNNEETTIEMISRGERSIGERSLTTIPGIVGTLFEQFADLKVLMAIGYNDPEMQRDVIRGGNLGDVLYYGTDGAAIDDGDADPYSSWFDSASGAFTTRFGPVGTDLSGYNLTVWVGGAPRDYTLGEVLGATRISISDEYEGSDQLPVGLTGAAWSIRHRAILTLSDIPGGILFPDYGGDVLTVPDDTIHVGGCTDIYVSGGTLEQKALAVSLISDADVVARREDARTTLGSTTITLQDLTAEEWADTVALRSSVVLEYGAGALSYRIIEKLGGGPPYQVRIGTEMTATASNISYLIVDDIDIDLNAPKETRYEGSDLRAVAGSAVVDTVSGLPNFVGVGVVDTDLVEILNGSNAGVYGIFPGGVSGGQIILQSVLGTTESPLQYKIYRLQDGIDLPLVRVKSVERLDSGLAPTGEMIPYKHPVDARSSSFQNPGRGAKAGTEVTATDGAHLRSSSGSDIVSAVNESGGYLTSLDFYELGLRVGEIVNITDSDNQGYYTIVEVGGAPGSTLPNAYELRLDRAPRWPVTAMEFSAGPPSYGSFRLYFLDPVSFEATYEDTLFSVDLGDQGVRRFRPDPDMYDQYLPTGETVVTLELTAASGVTQPYDPSGADYIDLLAHGLEVEDRVEITYAPLVGSALLTTHNLDQKTIKLDVGNGDETVLFSGTALGPDEIVSQINNQLSVDVAAKFEDPSVPGNFHLMLRDDRPISIENNGADPQDCTLVVFGTDRGLWQPWYPHDTFVGKQSTNGSFSEKGTYLVQALGSYPTGTLTLKELDGTAWTSIHTFTKELSPFARISRRGRQRISSTAMAEDGTDELGFYVFDVECISEGHGDNWNLGEDQAATMTGYSSEGWELTTDKEITSYSMAEGVQIHLSPRVLFVGNTDDPTLKTELSGLSIQITYERSGLVEDVHSYVRDPQSRVVVQNPLARSLLPIFVRTKIAYRGGPTTSDARADIATLIENVLPESYLEVSAMEKKIEDAGATYIAHPITVVGVAHGLDRSVVVERSVDRISSTRLAVLAPDDDGTTPEGASFIFLERTI